MGLGVGLGLRLGLLLGWASGRAFWLGFGIHGGERSLCTWFSLQPRIQITPLRSSATYGVVCELGLAGVRVRELG